MLTRKTTNTLLIVYAAIFVLCMIGWGIMAGLSRDGILSTTTHRYVMLALVTVTCCAVCATLQLAILRALRVMMAEQGGADGYADGYADGLAAASAARGKVAQMPPRGSIRS